MRGTGPGGVALSTVLLIVAACGLAGTASATTGEPIEISIRYTAGWTLAGVTFPLTFDCQPLVQTSAPPTFVVRCTAPQGSCNDPSVEVRRVGLLGGIEGASLCEASDASARCGFGPAEPPIERAIPACRNATVGGDGSLFTCIAQPAGNASLADAYGEVTCRFTHTLA